MGIVGCVNGSGWLHRFTHCHVLSQYVKQGEIADISAKVRGGGEVTAKEAHIFVEKLRK